MPNTMMTDSGGGLPKFSPRTTQPSYSNIYYSSGNPFKGDLSMWSGGNCTAYAWGRFHEIMSSTADSSGCWLPTYNAEDWFGSVQGYSKGSTPKLGAVLCLRDGPYSGLGHVAIVEEISSDGKTIKTSESGYNAYVFQYKERHYPNWNSDGYGFQGFIYNPIKFDNSGAEISDEQGAFGIDFQKRASKLISSDSYTFLADEKDKTPGFEFSATASLKSAIEGLVSGIKSGVTFVYNTIKSVLSGVSIVVDDSFAKNLNKTIKATPKIVRKQSLLSFVDTVIEAPFVELNIGGYTIGSFKGDLDLYPNYISDLQVSRQNGIINQYTIRLSHQIRPGEDSNLLDELFSTVNYDKITIKYGDANSGIYFQDMNAMITNISMNRNYTSMNISYTVEATSEGELIKTFMTSFPAVTDRPSNVLRDLIYNNPQTSNVVLSAFPGMRNRMFVESNGLIPTNDSIVDIDSQQNVNVLDYINFLVGCMSNQVVETGMLRNSIYYSTFIDNDPTNPDGAYIKVTEVFADVNPYKLANNVYNITIGYPQDIVYSFSVDSTDSWELLYKNNQKVTEYYYTITNNGDIKKQYSPTLESSTEIINEINKNWWTQMIKFPLTAQLTIKGLVKPVMLMDYINIDVVFYGQRHITSGVYAITGQTDFLSGSGYKTTLSLVRVSDS